MRLIKNIVFISLAAAMLHGCIDRYYPDDIEYEQMLFIEASITDDPGVVPYVLFKHTSSLSGNKAWDPWNPWDDPVLNTSGATIYIENNEGERWYFTEQGGGWGTYHLTDPDFSIQEGESYMLYIETQDGHIFESQYEKYMPSPPVEEIRYAHETWETDETGEATDGYRFYISTSSEDEEPLYLRWSLDATYSYMVPYIAYWYWTGSALIDTTNYELRLCYKDEDIGGIYTGTSEGMAINRVADAPLHGVSRIGDRLQIQYSLHVKQARINSSAYRFWNDLKSLLYETGGLYETVPFRITGNISCVSHDDISVAGLFEVAGVSETRTFVSPQGDIRVVTDRCVPDTIRSFEWNQLPAGSWVTGEPPVYVTSDARCFDCTEKGGYTQTPPFWEK